MLTAWTLLIHSVVLGSGRSIRLRLLESLFALTGSWLIPLIVITEWFAAHLSGFRPQIFLHPVINLPIQEWPEIFHQINYFWIYSQKSYWPYLHTINLAMPLQVPSRIECELVAFCALISFYIGRLLHATTKKTATHLAAFVDPFQRWTIFGFGATDYISLGVFYACAHLLRFDNIICIRLITSFEIEDTLCLRIKNNSRTAPLFGSRWAVPCRYSPFHV